MVIKNNKDMKDDKIPLHDDCIRIPTLEDAEEKDDTQDAGTNKSTQITTNSNTRYNKLLFNTIINGTSKRIDLNNYRKQYKLREIFRPEGARSIPWRQILIILTLSITVALLVCLSLNIFMKKVNQMDDQYQRAEAPMPTSTTSNYPLVSFTNNKKNFELPVYKYPSRTNSDLKNILKDDEMARMDDYMNRMLDVLAEKPPQPGEYIPGKETVLTEDIYWGPEIEDALPKGFGQQSTEIWERYVNQSEIVKMEVGCGRMQNRLVTFRDGVQACVRYRQNTDQIQGEIFSYYLGKFLNLSNLAPSVVKVVDLKDKLWADVADDIASAQWNTNRAVVLTQYIPSLEAATIPDVFKPSTRHLNKFDVLRIVMKENSTISKPNKLLDVLNSNEKDNPSMDNTGVEYFDTIEMKLSNKTLLKLLELAQWADLIIFDYLTANLDRIVNNLFNYQWNSNIMDGPAHNLAKQMDSGLLVFLDNESGLLHGYRLLQKYDMYHSLMLNNLCVFRKSTIDAILVMYGFESLNKLFDSMYKDKNDAVTRDVLPPLPDKNKKILYERLNNIVLHVKKCKETFSSR